MNPAAGSPVSVSLPAAAQRSVALDFFRGLALVTILINHVPWNPWYWATPSRFGFSDATDIFVFISGYVAALAYGRLFERQGWWAGTRHVYRRWLQIYAAHVLMFVLLVALCVAGNAAPIGPDYIKALNLMPVFDTPGWAVGSYMSLRYVPNYFDMLPMYLGIMALLPFIFAAGKVWRGLALAIPVIIYGAAYAFGLELEADATTGRAWFFNPFCWQLLFYIGFAFGRGYIPTPRWHGWLALTCSLIVAAAACIEFGATFFYHPLFSEWRYALLPYTDKSHLGLLRVTHFLALAYLLSLLVRRWPALWHSRLVQPLAHLGRNSLPAFVMAMALSFVCGMALDYWGRTHWLPVALVNLAGLLLLFGLSHMTSLLKTGRWLAPADKPAIMRA